MSGFLTRRKVIGMAAAALPAASCGRLRALVPRPPELVPFAVPSAPEAGLVVHFLNRLTWGVAPGEFARVAAMAASAEEATTRFVEEQLAPESIDDAYVRAACAPLEAIRLPVPELFEYKPSQLDEELTRQAVIRAVHSRRQLHEVMVGFWSDHFNIDASKLDCQWFKTADDRDVIRRHALGNFRDLLRASALSPAMLFYLDGRRNLKHSPGDRPNENYARELLELHTLGVNGGYSQQDVMEAARCLTGWTVTGREVKLGIGRVEFRPAAHDDGAKTVLGHPIPAGGGPADLDALLGIVTDHPATARFLAGKLCRWFIADNPPAAAVSAVAQSFQSSRGDIRSCLRTLFQTPEFATSRGTKIKRPFHFVVSALRASGAVTHAGGTVKRALRVMGHVPFHYPTPEGPAMDGEAWLATLLHRWDFAAALASGKVGCSRVNPQRLITCAGGLPQLLTHCFGRPPTDGELSAGRETSDPLALALAAPAFQMF
jgi:uncharacterized protein (DUF1800 family)